MFNDRLLPDPELIHYTQCFPLYRYEPIETQHPDGDMFQQAGFNQAIPAYERKSAITQRRSRISVKHNQRRALRRRMFLLHL